MHWFATLLCELVWSIFVIKFVRAFDRLITSREFKAMDFSKVWSAVSMGMVGVAAILFGAAAIIFAAKPASVQPVDSGCTCRPTYNNPQPHVPNYPRVPNQGSLEAGAKK